MKSGRFRCAKIESVLERKPHFGGRGIVEKRKYRLKNERSVTALRCQRGALFSGYNVIDNIILTT